jgi:hypothetical protein
MALIIEGAAMGFNLVKVAATFSTLSVELACWLMTETVCTVPREFPPIRPANRAIRPIGFSTLADPIKID